MDAEDKIYILNTNAAAIAAANNHDRNYIHLFRPHDKSKLNIVGTFEDSIKSEYLDLTEEDEIGDVPLMVEEFCSESNNSFGMVARLDFPDYRDIALGIKVEGKINFYRSKDAFLRALDNASLMFCIDESHPNKNNKDKPAGYKFTYEQYRRALYARCLLANIWCFGIDFKEFNGELEQALADSNQVHIVHKKDNITRIYGRPTDELINEYANIVCILAANGAEVPFSEVYVEENKNLLCSDNDALYSGVIPRLKNITFDPPSVGNNKVNKMTLELGRTSFMTIMGLHLTIGGKYCDDLLNHPFLKTITADGVSLLIYT